MRGPSGAGKSTFIKHHLARNAAVCSADDFFMGTDLDGKVEYQFDPTKLAEAHSVCMGEFLVALYGNAPLVVVDNTSIAPWEYENYVTAAVMQKYTVQVVTILPETRDDVLAMVEAADTTKGVPAGIVLSMWANWVPHWEPAHEVVFGGHREVQEYLDKERVWGVSSQSLLARVCE